MLLVPIRTLGKMLVPLVDIILVILLRILARCGQAPTDLLLLELILELILELRLGNTLVKLVLLGMILELLVLVLLGFMLGLLDLLILPILPPLLWNLVGRACV